MSQQQLITVNEARLSGARKAAHPEQQKIHALPRSAKLLIQLLHRLQHGKLALITPSGTRVNFTGAESGPSADIHMHDWRVANKVLHSAEIGFAEAYRDKLFDTSDLSVLLEFAVANSQAIEKIFFGNRLFNFVYRIVHAFRANTRAGSKKNIHAHYDLGNEFYSRWLDPSMTYSSALFNNNFSQSLDSAQQAKYERILTRLNLQPAQHILEIGCGWGGFTEYAAKTRGLKITGITISQAQFDFAQQRILNAGLNHLVELRMQDYRDVCGEFDAVVSIEMFEAVGEKFWPGYFKVVERTLKPGAKAIVQTITIAADAFDYYRKSSDFIRQFIFPGGMLPSVPVFVGLANQAGLTETRKYEFGFDYAETLRRWRTRYDDIAQDLVKLGFDDAFQRIWRFYFCYCEAGFRSGRTNVMQIELIKESRC
ncbi:MAG: cyclopropane-fatty-acyl-phospholipid synthase family protein [Burkholderiales bacterium]